MLATFGDLDLALCAVFALAFAMALLFGSALAGGFLDLFDSVLAGASSPSCSGVKDAWDVDFQMFRLRSFFPLEVTFLGVVFLAFRVLESLPFALFFPGFLPLFKLLRWLVRKPFCRPGVTAPDGSFAFRVP